MRNALAATLLPLVLTALLAAAGPAFGGPVTHVVRPGENLFRIALRYGVTVEAIARANGIVDPERIRAGLVLTIPASSMRPAALTSAAAARPGIPRAAAVARSYRVQRGDTLFAIARRFDTTVAALQATNGLRSELIHPGQVLTIPGERPVPSTPGAPRPPATAPSRPAPRPFRTPLSVEVGDEVRAAQALRLRSGPKSYLVAITLVAPETPLRVLARTDGWYQVRLPDGDEGWVRDDELRTLPRATPAPAALVRGADIVRDAMRYLGVPYRWGGTSAQSVDCSGFVYLIFGARLPDLARLRSYDYFRMGTPVKSEDLLPGDLVFFTTYAPGPSHVGIYIGDGRFIHASSGARRVVVSPLADAYYAARYLGARRLLAP
ncbi:MAG: LysM peptidoglycan-binding domain-containing protein [Armatimonadota bacterium]|nr:LysM peptidoglycan-binding domain-containing protein [Armatimonadota bacterium]MDR7451990.1 LysM peptidoglycan-binding domain-containing protein [Armatimonadota bacterium]MDR7467881.1 LysM peptidoglycan-binding domain-containing protein [Armatimonadota bacterium]MDR7494266.1 LysM peptidoglycan-binding domain-containing protein [Armatimonadota bacterium]MDR7500047.1 LysM peptidoglycan-binding domain-containing protein [Armatimonadota bacterium]